MVDDTADKHGQRPIASRFTSTEGGQKTVRCTLQMPRKELQRSEKQQKQTKFILTVRNRLQDELKSITVAATGPPTPKANTEIELRDCMD